MAATSVTRVYDTLITGTLRKVARQRFEDNVLRGDPLLKYLMAGDRYIPCDGGHVISEPVFLSKNSTAKSYARWEDLDVTPQDEGSTALFDWARYNVNIAWAGDEEMQNSGTSAVLNVLRDKMELAEMTLHEEMSQDLYGTGDGTDGKTLCGLQRIAADDPTTNSLGRIAASETGWRNQANTNAVAFNTSNAGEEAWQAGLLNASFGTKRPDLIVTSRTIWALYATALRARGEISLPAGVGDSGFDPNALNFAGMPVIWDRHVDQSTDTPNGPGVTYAYMLDTKSLKLRYHPRRNFAVGDPVRPANKDAKYWPIFWMGQLTTNSRRSQHVFTNMS